MGGSILSGLERLELKPASSVAPAQWLNQVLSPSGTTVASYVPDTFDRFARVRNPAFNRRTGHAVDWNAVGQRNGNAVDAQTTWETLRDREVWLDPESGTIDLTVARALSAVLASETLTPERVFFAFWHGYADMNDVSAPIVTLPPDRSMLLFTGPLCAVGSPTDTLQRSRLPLRWWPADHAWCVGNDIYARSVFVAGSAKTIELVLNSPGLDAVSVTALSPTAPEDF